MFQNIILHEEELQLSNVQKINLYQKSLLKKSTTQQCTEYVVAWLNQRLNQRGVRAKIRNTPNGSPDPKFPNLIDIYCKLLVSPITLQVTCPKDPEKAKFLGVNAEKTDENPSDVYIQALYYDDGTIVLVGFAYREDLGYYGPDRAIPKEATYRVYRKFLRNINELPEALEQTANNNTIKYV